MSAAPSLLSAPHIERGLLSGLLDDDAKFAAVAEIVRPSMFSERHHSAIFAAMEDLRQKGSPIDVVTLLQHMEQLRALPDIGGQAYLMGLANEGAGSQNVMHYAAAVRKSADRRKTAKCLARSIERLERGDDSEAVLGDLIPDLRGLGQGARRRGWRAIRLSDIDLSKQPKQIIPGLIEAGSLCLLAGQSGVGKTFFAIALAFAVVSGSPWFGREVRRGAVVYFAAEAPHGAMVRAVALCIHHAASRDLPLVICPETIDAVEDGGRIIDFVESVAAELGEAVQLIVIDTFSRAFAGHDENSAQDVSRFVKTCDRVREATGAALLIVHHLGKDASKGLRGSTVLGAAADTVIEITGRRASVSKQRNMPIGPAMPFELTPVELGVGADGEPISTCVATFGAPEARLVTASAERRERRDKLADVEQLGLDSLHQVLSQPECRRGAPVRLHAAGAHVGQFVTTEKHWRAHFYAVCGGDPAERDADKMGKYFRRANTGLLTNGRIGRSDEFVWLSDAKRSDSPHSPL